jgi:hypothetical protein
VALALIAVGAGAIGAGCSNDENGASSDDAFTEGQTTFWDDLAARLDGISDAMIGPGKWRTPAPGNPWATGFAPTRVGQENILPDEAATFTKLAHDIQGIQRALLASNGEMAARAFHAKPHACVKGRFFLHVPDTLVKDARLPDDTDLATLKVGLLSDSAEPHDVWVRWSNGVGGTRRPDGEADVRGLALKVLGVAGDRLGDGGDFFKQEAGTQDFLMTNGATTPAPDSMSFAGFGVSQANIVGAPTLLGKAEAVGGFLKYLVNNPRVGSTLLHGVLTSTRAHNSIVGQQFWTGGALALGVEEDGTPRQAMKVTAITGRWNGDAEGHGTCMRAMDMKQALKDFVLPGKEANTREGGDANYLSTGPIGVKTFLKAGQVCVDVQVQFQRHDPAMLAAQNQSLEDTTVEWLEADSPFVSVATIVIPQMEDPASQEPECNQLSWNPWHALKEHRPLGNIMRARKEVLAASAEMRNAKLVK